MAEWQEWQKITSVHFLCVTEEHPDIARSYFYFLLSDVKICSAFPPPSDLHLLCTIFLMI